MTMGFRRPLCLLLCLCILGSVVPFPGSCSETTAEITSEAPSETAPETAEETIEETAEEAAKEAQNVGKSSLVPLTRGFTNLSVLFDHNLLVPIDVPDHSWLKIEYPDGIGSLYVIFHYEYGTYSITNNDSGEVAEVGQNSFLHDFVDLEALFGTAPTSITVSFDNGPLRINELFIFTTGQVPDYVQRWEPSQDGNVDLLLLSAHGDDDQLFFAGILPYYAGELGYQVQVVYLTNHRNVLSERCHEMLDGLYACGVRTYPVFGPFLDMKSTTLRTAYTHMAEHDVTEEDLVGFMVEQLRRFKPLVAVTHDIYGEYGHGQHMLCADIMKKACQISQDPQAYPELAQQYGVWDVPKTYLHLYYENRIVLDWDVPLSRFDGMTAFEVSRDLGFPCHKTQYRLFLWYYAQGKTAKQITQYSPCYYGLFRSTVGLDEEKNDFFENISAHIRAQRDWALPRRSV